MTASLAAMASGPESTMVAAPPWRTASATGKTADNAGRHAAPGPTASGDSTVGLEWW